MAAEVLMEISKDEREKAILRNRRIHQADLESNRITAERNRIEAEKKAREEGERKGREEGRAEGMLAVAKNLFALGLPVDQIVSATGLTREEVESLKSRVNE